MAVQYSHTNPMPAHMPFGRAPNVSITTAPTPALASPRTSASRAALIAPRYSAADVESNRGNSKGPPEESVGERMGKAERLQRNSHSVGYAHTDPQNSLEGFVLEGADVDTISGACIETVNFKLTIPEIQQVLDDIKGMDARQSVTEDAAFGQGETPHVVLWETASARSHSSGSTHRANVRRSRTGIRRTHLAARDR